MSTENSVAPDVEVAIIGAGPGGIAAAVKLIHAGIDDFTLIERSYNVGGSWHENRYPGVGVDVPAFSYQYSFARNRSWSRLFPKGHEVQQYHADVAEQFGIFPKVRFGTNVIREVWSDAASMWTLHMDDGTTVTARFVISAVGAFVRPKSEVGIAGVDDFGGKILRPTDWDHDYDLSGKSLGVIGTGASAVQIIPEISAEAGHVQVFQRTPVWSLPKPDISLGGPGGLLLRAPVIQSAMNAGILIAIDALLRGISGVPLSLSRPLIDGFDRLAIGAYARYVRAVVHDPDRAAALTPGFGPLAKRPTISNEYLRAFNRDNVGLTTTGIDTITAAGIRTVDGAEQRFDALVLATGYEVFSDPETYRAGAVVGRGGFDLANFYAENGLQAYESVSVPGLPNRWTLCGPYSWTGSGWHAFVEMTADHAVRAIRETRSRHAVVCEISREAADAYHQRVLHRSHAMRYYLANLNGHVPTYYRNSQGDSTYLRPDGFFAARRSSRTYPLEDYRFENAQHELVPA